MYLPILYAAIIGVFQVLADKFSMYKFKYKTELISFAAGMAVTYLFLVLLPDFVIGVTRLRLIPERLIFVYVLLGFSLLHIAEKYVYQHAPPHKLRREVAFVHDIAMFLYHIIIGVIILNISKQNFYAGLVFFIPILLHTTMIRIPEIKVKKSKVKVTFEACATMIGVLLAIMLPVSRQMFFSLLGFMGGALLFIVVRDIIPKYRKGKVEFFLMGIIIYMFIITSLWNFLG